MKIGSNIDQCIKCNNTNLEFNDNSIDTIIDPNRGYAEKLPIVKCKDCGTYHYFIMNHEDEMFLELVENDDIKYHRLDLWKWSK